MPADGVPTLRELRAAYWVGRALRPEGSREEDRRDSYRSLPLGGRLDYDDFDPAELLLITAGLAAVSESLLVPTDRLQRICSLPEEAGLDVLLSAVMEGTAPLWLRAAAGGDVVKEELIPERALVVLERLLPDLNRRESFLLARARRVDIALRNEIGAAGEEAVVFAARAELEGAGRPDLSAQVQRVSLISDELGYDVIAPRLDGAVRRLEVKTSRNASSVMTVYLSRNEVSIGLNDASWSLVVCALDHEGDAHVFGWMEAADLVPFLPVDAENAPGRWETARLRVPMSVFAPALPPLT